MARPLGDYFCTVHFLLFVCLLVLSVCRHSLRSLVIGRSIDQCPLYINSPWVRGRRRGHHPAPHRMPFNKRSFFLAATAIELALFIGYGRSQYTGNCTNVINTTLVDNERVDAFAARLRSLAELCGNIHSEGTMKQQLIQGLPEYLRTDAFVYNTAQRSYQQLSTYVAGKYRATKDVMALANRGSPGGSSRKGQTSTGPRLRDCGVVGRGQ